MPALVTLQGAEALSVDPGGQTTCEVRVRNTGTVVEQFHLEALGDGAGWIDIEPPVLSLFPDAEGSARVVFRPPQRHDTPNGVVYFGVKVTPETAAGEGYVEEGQVSVGRFDDVAAELLPLQTKSRGGSRHRVAVDSRGNGPLRVLLQAIDPGEDLDLSVKPTVLTIDPGRAAFAYVRIRPRKRMLTGTPKVFPFKVIAAADGLPPIELDGSRVQTPVLPKWAIPVVAVLAGLVLLWFVLLKPQINSAAKSAVASPLNAVDAKASQAAASADAAARTASSVAAATTTTTAASIGDNSGTTTTTASTTTSTTATTLAAASSGGGAGGGGQPFDQRISVVAGPGESQGASYTVPAGKTLSVTDLVAQNDNDSAGTMHIQRQTASPTATNDLLTMRLETFHDQSYHFDSPLVFKAGEKVRLLIDCRPSQAACSVGLLFSGTTANA